MSEERFEYVLINSDSGEIFHLYHPRTMTISELEQANKKADLQTGGTFSWIPYDPATMGRFLQPQSDY